MAKPNIKKPVGYENDLGELTALYGENGIDTGWGFVILRFLSDERFNALYQYGSVEVVDRSSWLVRWALIVKKLTGEEARAIATKKFGEVVKIHTGPKGGFQWVQYGNKIDRVTKWPEGKFYSSRFCPQYDLGDPRIEKDPPSPAMVSLARKQKLAKARKEKKRAKGSIK